MQLWWLVLLTFFTLLLHSCPCPGASVTNANCSGRPPMSAFQNCCKRPPIRLGHYKKDCGRHFAEGIRLVSCGFECVFNAAEALNGSSLRMDSLESLLREVLYDNAEFVSAYLAGYRQCAAQEQDMLNNLKRQRRKLLEGQRSCSPLAMMYSVCAHRYVYAHCPASHWSNTRDCIEARDYLVQCELPTGQASPTNDNDSRIK